MSEPIMPSTPDTPFQHTSVLLSDSESESQNAQGSSVSHNYVCSGQYGVGKVLGNVDGDDEGFFLM